MQEKSRPLFDTALAEAFRRRAWRAFNAARSPAKTNTDDGASAPPAAAPDFLLARAAEDLRARLAVVQRHFTHAVDIYSHTDLAADALAASGQAASVARVESLPELASRRYPTQICAAEELILPPAQADLITSLLSLQNMNDIPGLLIRIRRALKPDGLFLGALCGAGTLGELRESLLQAEVEIYGGATPHIAPFPDVRDMGGLLQRAGFALPVADAENLTVRYASAFALMADLRAMGAQNALLSRSRKPLSRRFFRRAAEIYAERFSDADGRIRASFCLIWLSGWAPHEGQQKPMRPGSAKVSLAEALAEAEAQAKKEAGE